MKTWLLRIGGKKMKYVSVAGMVAIEKEADASGHTYPKMMELAGKGLAEIINEVFGYLNGKKVLGLIGSGNNGGDTLVALAYLKKWGWSTTAYIVKERAENDPHVARVLGSGGEILEHKFDQDLTSLKVALENHNVLLDGILGTGIKLPLRSNLVEILSFIQEHLNDLTKKPYIIAVDCPSGVDCDTGQAAAEALSAELTVTMAAVKQGLLKFPAYNLIGELRCVGIGLPQGLEAYEKVHREVVDYKWVQGLLPGRPLDAHKSTFGVAMILAGSLNYSGAVLLAGEAAFRSGAGWVTLAVPEPLHPALAGSFLEATWVLLAHENGWISAEASKVLLDNLDRVDTLLLGPGFGMQTTTGDFVYNVLVRGGDVLPHMVIDADGLKLLAQIPAWENRLPKWSILTPHPGEMSVLTGESVDEIVEDKINYAETYAKEWGHVVVLKGAFTVIASPDGRTAIIPVATPSLARAGTGDVLAGLITGFRAQGLGPYQAAVAGAWIHAQAGLRAADIMGSSASVLAGDVLAAVSDIIADLIHL
jgi:NAD(P)H-hydrate epimerase